MPNLSGSRYVEASHKEPGEKPDGQGQADHSNSESPDHNHQVILGKAGEVEHGGGGVCPSHVGVGSKIECTHGNFVFDVIQSFSLNECL